MTPLRARLLLSMASILFTVGMLEGFARVVLQVQPIPNRFQLDSDLGWAWTPGYSAIETRNDINYTMTINSQGLRNAPVAVPKPDGVFRILAIGDSVTEGLNVNLEDTFVKRLEVSLRNGDPERQIEIVNAGTDDYGSEQEYIWLKERGLDYQPDFVIVTVYLNDSRSFTRPNPVITATNNFFYTNSAAYYFYSQKLSEQRVVMEEESPDFRFRYGDELDAREWVTNPETLTNVIQLASGDWGAAWNDTQLVVIQDWLLKMNALCKENNIGLLVVLSPVNVQVDAQVETPLDLDKPQKVLTQFAQEQGIPVVDLLPVLRQHTEEPLFVDQAHYTPLGHQIVADAIQPALLNLIQQH
jgi:lysophospholipase L1-like esterase